MGKTKKKVAVKRTKAARPVVKKAWVPVAHVAHASEPVEVPVPVAPIEPAPVDPVPIPEPLWAKCRYCGAPAPMPAPGTPYVPKCALHIAADGGEPVYNVKRERLA